MGTSITPEVLGVVPNSTPLLQQVEELCEMGVSVWDAVFTVGDERGVDALVREIKANKKWKKLLTDECFKLNLLKQRNTK